MSEMPGHRWELAASGGEHRRPRISLFTPLRVARGPDASTHLFRIRKTQGVRLDTFEPFEIADDWTQSGNAHRKMSFPWVGKTTFQETSDFLMEVGNVRGKRHGDGVQGAQEDELFSTPLRPSVPEGEPVAAPVCELREGVGAATPRGMISSLSCVSSAVVELGQVMDAVRQLALNLLVA